MPSDLAEEASDRRRRAAHEQDVDPVGLSASALCPPASGARRSPPADIGGGDPEDRQLQMPGAQDVAREDRGDVDAVKAPRVGPVVGGGPAHQCLREEEERDDHEVLDRGPLARRWSRRGAAADGRAPPSPCQPRKSNLPKANRTAGRPAEKRDQAERAPEDCVAGRRVAGHRIVGEVVRVRVRLAGTVGDGGPGGPGKKGVS